MRLLQVWPHPKPSIALACLFLAALLLLDMQLARAAVTLIEFKAETISESTNRITWRTGAEIGTFGFSLWRGVTATGPWQRIATLPAEGDSIGGATYSYDDPNQSASAQVWYKLQELANQGNPCYGPVSPGQGTRIDATNCPSTTEATATTGPTSTPTATLVPSPTPTTPPSATPTSAPTATPTAVSSATLSASPSATPTPPTPLATLSTTPAPSTTATSSPTATATATPTFISVILTTSTPTSTPIATPIATPTGAVEATATATASPTTLAPPTSETNPTETASPAAPETAPTSTPQPTAGFILLPSPTPASGRPTSTLPTLFLLVGLGSLGAAAALGIIAWRNMRQQPPGDGP